MSVTEHAPTAVVGNDVLPVPLVPEPVELLAELFVPLTGVVADIGSVCTLVAGSCCAFDQLSSSGVTSSRGNEVPHGYMEQPFKYQNFVSGR